MDKALISSRSARIQNRKAAEPPHGSQSPVEERKDYSYVEIYPISLRLKDVVKGQTYEDCSRSDDASDSGLQNDRVQENGKKTKKCYLSADSNDLTDTTIYLELIVDDADQGGADKSLEPVYDEQKEIRESLESVADVSKEPNPDYVNSGFAERSREVAMNH